MLPLSPSPPYMPVHEKEWEGLILEEVDASLSDIKVGQKMKNEHLSKKNSSGCRTQKSHDFPFHSIVELHHVRGKHRFGVFEEFWERALVVDVSVGDAQGRCAALGKGCDVHGFVVVG